MRTESTPLGKFEESFNAMFWDAHPYSWPVVGWPSDIPAITKAQADDYFRLFYAPNNITAILVGDFDPKEALAIFKKRVPEIDQGLIEANMGLGLALMRTPRYAAHGIGFIERQKMCASVDLVNTYMRPPRRVACSDVFSDEFLTKIAMPEQAK